MSLGPWLVLLALIAVALYAAGVLALVVLGRRGDARALAGFIPDCLILFKRLLGDPRVGRRRKAMLAVTVVYLAAPVDLVPDVIPVAGQLDDAILVALVLRAVLRGSGPRLLREHWPGPEQSLRVLQRLAWSGSRETTAR